MDKPQLNKAIPGTIFQYRFRDVVPGSNRKFGTCSCICHLMPSTHEGVPCCGPGAPGYNPAVDLPEEGDPRQLFKMAPGGKENK